MPELIHLIDTLKETPQPTLNQPDKDLILDAKLLDCALTSLDTLVIPKLINRIRELNEELELSNLANKGYLDGQRDAFKTVLNLLNNYKNPENPEYELINQILENLSFTIIHKLKEPLP